MFGCEIVFVGWPDVGMAAVVFGAIVAVFWIIWRG
jgi:hypothetical protein